VTDAEDGVVIVVDDDDSTRASLENLVRSVGLRVITHASARAFLASDRPDAAACLVLDVRLPGLSGLDVQAKLSAAGSELPIVFITGHGDIPMSVQAMKAGAVEFLSKPFREQALLDAIAQGLERDRKRRAERSSQHALEQRYELLTARERSVFALVVSGLANKQIAAELGTSEATVKIHRQHVMQKMQAGSLPALVRMADRLGAELPKS
jgi:FixJ family two-component response regulator